MKNIFKLFSNANFLFSVLFPFTYFILELSNKSLYLYGIFFVKYVKVLFRNLKHNIIYIVI